MEVRAKDFGKTSPIEYLDRLKLIELFHPFVEYFVKEHGYERDKSIRAASYDWRLAPGKYLVTYIQYM